MTVLRTLFAFLAATLLSGAATAATFVGSYDIDVNGPGESGLEIQTQKLFAPFSFSLALNESKEVDLFRIWTDEADVGRDDRQQREITVNFSFTKPTGPGGDITGSTRGINLLLAQWGAVSWEDDGVQEFAFSNNSVLRVKLHNTRFNEGLFGLNEGYANGANVKATLTLAAVPEPATWAMMIGGFGFVGGAARRSRANHMVRVIA